MNDTLDYSAHNPFANGDVGGRVTVSGIEFAISNVSTPTVPQMKFLATLLTDRDYTAHKFAGRIGQIVRADGEPVTFTGVSTLIDTLLDCPYPVRETAPESPEVPAGRYAVDTEDGHLAFYKVDRPKDGRWAGRTFVSVQASDDLHPVRGAARAAVLGKIAADPAAASRRYGRELGVCGVCGRTLTDEASREAGIGPVCAGKM